MTTIAMVTYIMAHTESLRIDRPAGDHHGSYGDVTSSIAGYPPHVFYTADCSYMHASLRLIYGHRRRRLTSYWHRRRRHGN